MPKFIIKLHYYSDIIEAEDSDEAINKWFNEIESEPQQNLASFIEDNLKVKEYKGKKS